MASCGGKYKITGKTNLIPDGETILLQKQNNEQFEIVDSATVTNGSFSFKGEQKSPTIAILVHLNDKQSQIPPQLIALEKGDIYVTLDSVSHISGTPLNDRLQMYETKRRSYDTRIRNITNRYLKDYLSGQLSDSTFVILKKAFDKEQKGLETLTRNYILANTDNVTSIYLFLQNSFLFSPEEQRELIAHAAPSFKKNPAVKKVSHMLDRLKNVEPGMPYIDLPLQTIEGKETSLSTYIDKGKYILLDFWASWCPPCRRQTPYLKQLFERYDKRQFSIVGISFDTNREEWKEYMQKITIQGRGGTDFRPVFELIRKEQEKRELRNLKALIYFTDGDGIYPRQKPDYETAFVFVKKTENMRLVPDWAYKLVIGERTKI